MQFKTALSPYKQHEYSPLMFLTPFTSLSWAYQLHYYLCFRTHRRRAFLTSKVDEVVNLLSDICTSHEFHLLECRVRPDQISTVISLQPGQSIAKVMQTIKTNSSREFGLTTPSWARGYLARSLGRMRIAAVRQYLNEQARHHGYEARILPPVYRFRAVQPTLLKAAHATFELNHHLVFATQQRKGVFTSSLARALTNYWLRVASKRGFAIDQVSFVPDHVHLLLRNVPKLSVEECALALMNNGQHFIVQNFPQVLVNVGIDQLWMSSAYVGTCGDLTTALIRSWLRNYE